jgi:glutamate---cysteine ligase / carboxylate-amine ligase
VAAVAHRALQAYSATPEVHGERAALEPELYRQQIELASEPAETLDELAASLRRARAAVQEAAAAAGALAVAVPTPVVEPAASARPRTTANDRYHRIVDEYGETARDALVCGMHVHVEVEDPAEAVAVTDRVRPWLPVLLAVSANSPYWQGRDTGYASWRSQVWSRWPTGGPREPLGDADGYAATARLLKDWGAALDDGMLYFDVRPAKALPTVELRVADVCTDPEDTLLVAALSRGLVETVARERADGVPADEWRTDLLRAAHWRASRYGMAGTLVDPLRRELAPAAEVVRALVDHTAEALADAGDDGRVDQLLSRLLARGTGATRQRATLERSGDLREVVADLARRTSGVATQA